MMCHFILGVVTGRALLQLWGNIIKPFYRSVDF